MSPTESKSRSASRVAWLGVVTAVAVNLIALVGYAVKTGEAVGALTETSRRHTEDIRDLRDFDQRTSERIDQQYRALADMAGDIKAIRQAIDDDRRRNGIHTP
jgi:hypothetical protein